jgi:hypothetical protein
MAARVNQAWAWRYLMGPPLLRLIAQHDAELSRRRVRSGWSFKEELPANHLLVL